MKDPIVKLLVWYVMFTLIMLGVIAILSSCEVLKTKRTATKDSVAVVKTDTGRVTTNTTTNERKEDWWREVAEFGRGDTVTINNYTTTQPIRIIREGGTIQEVAKSINQDSLWGRRFDSLAVKLSTTEKSKETKVLNMWQIIGLAAGVWLVLTAVTKLKISIR